MIVVTRTVSVDESEIVEEFIRASGPGGQNVNKVATAVQLRFDVRRSPSLPAAVRERLIGIAGRRLTRDGILIILARRHRTREMNRREARERLVELLRRAEIKPVVRRATRPTLASDRRRHANKQQRSEIKRLRRPVSPAEG